MPVGSLLSRLTAALLNVVAPASCAACGRGAPGESGFCCECGLPKPLPPHELDGITVIAGGLYGGSIASAIHAFKYAKRAELAPTLANLIKPHTAGLELSSLDAWVPVPLHARRLAERGYNQSALLARELSKGRPARFLPRLIARTSATSQQAALARNERALNVRSAFVVRGKERPRRVVLVDDVVTTGATVSACVEALRSADIPVLAIVAIARALPVSADS